MALGPRAGLGSMSEGRSMRRSLWVLGLALFFGPVVPVVADTCTCLKAQSTYGTTPTCAETPAAAIQAHVDWLNSSNAGDDFGGACATGYRRRDEVFVKVGSPGSWTGSTISGSSSWVTKQQVFQMEYTCATSAGAVNPFYVDSIFASGTYTCTPDECAAKAGQTAVVNWTAGWARSGVANADDYVGTVATPPSTVCDGSCNVSGLTVKDAWRSAVPSAQGLYRLSADFQGTYTATACSGKTAGTDPDATPMTCPGYVGEVNGRKTCVPKVGSPLPGASAPAGVSPQVNANPRAGLKPATGPGAGSGPDGRTPLVGDGGPGGGDSSATNMDVGNNSGGGGGSGTGEGKDYPTCGYPGGPPCKIDETGTPAASNPFGDPVAEGWFSSLTGIFTSPSVPSTAWSWSFSLPTGCTAMSVGPFVGQMVEIDPCQWQAMIHDLMSVIWCIAGLWACIGMVGRTLGGS